MQDESKSTYKATRNTSSNASSDPVPNAFSQEFLDRLRERDEQPYAALECETRGPWIAVERPVSPSVSQRERWSVQRSWESAEEDPPAATFSDRELAFLYAAGQEVGGRRSVLAVSREPDGDRGHAVIQWTQDGQPEVVGHIATYDEDTFAAFRVLETLLRATEPLAQVLDAAGSSIAELVGRRLMTE